MSDEEKPKLALVETKTVRFRGDIADALYRLILDFQQKYHRMPEGLLVGPTEWLELKHYGRSLQRIMSDDFGKEVTSFHGIPVYTKVRPGLDLIPGEEVVSRLAMGLATKSTEGR